MSEIITAIYENGVLRPQKHLSLPNGQTVRIQILTEEAATEAEQVIQSLVAAGLVTPPPVEVMWSQLLKKRGVN